MPYIFVILLLTVVSSLNSQSIEGKIVDSQGNPIEAVYIIHIQNGEHTHSDFKGHFQLDNINEGDSLLVKHISYDSRYFKINDLNKPVKIELLEISIALDAVVIQPDLDALNLFTEIDVRARPVQSSQEILRNVPGLFIGQHAGGGKAEQIFLRGFDIDHGTDISLSVEGMPVNMVSHAHGQGYADMHFIIPETINAIDFGKGPYRAEKGNFTTAGFVDYKLKKRINQSQISFELGQFNTSRFLIMTPIVNTETQSTYIAAEHLISDGPFESPQNFNRTNILVKYHGQASETETIGLNFSYFYSDWNASGQIPIRAVEDNSIGRFGAIDDTEGGNTSRMNAQFEYTKYLNEDSFIKNSLYYSRYDFDLFSNFTFFLNDPINGDQIRQKESRSLFGFNSTYNRILYLGDEEALFQVGVGMRQDYSRDNSLERTLNRKEVINTVQFGDIDERNTYAFAGISYTTGPWVFNPSVRFDYFDFTYTDDTQVLFTEASNNAAIISPKMSVLFNQTQNLQWYLKTGIGFHSNDTRVVINQQADNILPKAIGADFGAIWKPIPELLVNFAHWYLYLEQEFVYVGDEGIVEPSGETRRYGLDFSLRYQLSKSLIFNADANYTIARSIEDEPGQDYIPLAPDFTFTSGLSYTDKKGLLAGIQMRHLSDRPAVEDNSIVADGYTVVDFNLSKRWKKFDFGIQVQNLFDVEWNETQFATLSRLANEVEAVEEIHFTPGTPLFVKGSIGYIF
ncbi:MAG: TonB-dependent receptor plug domain-containing protein [Saprospiraceae bacterium]|nr:TonB-dependent receptor plug domain-containing protein [Saprospiraceae bacterium]